MEEVHPQGISRALAVFLIAAGCAASPANEADAWGLESAPASELVGMLDGRPVTYGDVGRYLRTKDPEAFSRSLEGVVLERVTRDEAERLGIEVPARVLARATERRMNEWEERVRAAARASGGGEIDPAVWLQRVGGVSLAQFREWVKGHTEVELLQDRLLRYELLLSPHVEVSILVVKDKARAEQLTRKLHDGADFARLARSESVHSSASSGGRIPFPLVPLDINEPTIREALFKSKSGYTEGPFPTTGGGTTWYQIYRVHRRTEPVSAEYPVLEPQIARELVSRPVPVGEYERWRRRILLRHGFEAALAPGESG